MRKAVELYHSFFDLDFMDYTETAENDILFCAGLIDALGEDGARAFLYQYFNN